MFKTSEECSLELISHSRMVPYAGHQGEVMCMMIEPSMDTMPCSAARVSFGNEDKTGEDRAKDVKLMKYLADHQHMTPFEYQHATFLVECPLFIRSQIHRHRTFSFNEISRRYTEEDLAFWQPSKWRAQAATNRQASEGELPWPALLFGTDGNSSPYEDTIEIALESYRWLLANGYCREQARAVLPQSLLTKFYMGGNLRNWAHFIQLRTDGHAQPEVQVVARKIADKLRELWPTSCEALGI